ncbi:MAG: DUF2232 domain-containing protein [Clostridium sp.]
MNNKKGTNELATSALLTALSVVIFLVASLIPIIDIFAILVAHIPIAVIYLRYNGKYAAISTVASTILVLMILGPISGIRYFFLNALIGIVLGFCAKKKYSSVTTILALGMANLILVGVVIKILGALTGVDVLKQSLDMMVESYKSYLSVLKGAGVSLDMIPFSNDANAFREYVGLAMPGVLLVTSGAVGYIWYLISQKVLSKLKIEIEPVRRFSEWYVPSKVAYPVMILILITLFTGGDELSPFGFAVRLLFLVLFVVNGLATVSYFLIQGKFKPGVVRLITVVVALLLTNILVFVGLFEYAFNFRGLDSNRRKLLSKK